MIFHILRWLYYRTRQVACPPTNLLCDIPYSLLALLCINYTGQVTSLNHNDLYDIPYLQVAIMLYRDKWPLSPLNYGLRDIPCSQVMYRTSDHGQS